MKDLHDIAQRSMASQDKWELEKLLENIRIPTGQGLNLVVEIGIDQGRSLDVWNEALEPKKIIGIDVLAPKRPLPYTILLSERGSRDEYIKRVVSQECKIDFLFIDGSHTYSDVRHDFFYYSQFASVVALHDVCYHHDKTEEVDVFWKEIQDQYKEKAITIHNPSGEGTGVGVVYL